MQRKHELLLEAVDGRDGRLALHILNDTSARPCLTVSEIGYVCTELRAVYRQGVPWLALEVDDFPNALEQLELGIPVRFALAGELQPINLDALVPNLLRSPFGLGGNR